MGDEWAREEGGASDAALIARMRAGDDAAKAALTACHMSLLRAMAARLCGGAASRDELVQAGAVGLLLAARAYDAAQGARFTTYAVPWVLGEMRRSRAAMLDAMGAGAARRRIAACEAEFRRREGRSPRLEELAERCGASAFDVASALCAGAGPLPLEGADGEGLCATLCDGGAEIDVEKIDLRAAIARLPEGERRLVWLRYFRDRTQAQAAATLGRSQAQVSRMERRALDRLRAMLIQA